MTLNIGYKTEPPRLVEELFRTDWSAIPQDQEKKVHEPKQRKVRKQTNGEQNLGYLSPTLLRVLLVFVGNKK
jgi:hypothetical protein